MYRYGDWRAVPVIVLGVLITAVPLAVFRSSSGGGPVTFAVRMEQLIAAVAGICTVGVGYHSYRTGDLRPAKAVGGTALGWMIVGGLLSLYEVTGGPLVPIWAWELVALAVPVLALVNAYGLTGGE